MSEVFQLNAPSILTLSELFKLELAIPSYQRPYKWPVRSINLLINDLKEIGLDSNCKNYRLGTIIVVKGSKENDSGSSDNVFFIVDGQQRIVSLLLLVKALKETGIDLHYCIPKFLERDKYLNNIETQETMRRNFDVFLNRLRIFTNRQNGNAQNSLPDALTKALAKIEFVCIPVENTAQAFQIFDSQNYRGKKLNPHDLLKAYHLRCMDKVKDDKKSTVESWEAQDQKEICDLFDLYLHRIICWKMNKYAGVFTEHEIDEFKGIEEATDFPYAKRTLLTRLEYAIGELFISGKDFFDIVKHYKNQKKELADFLDQKGLEYFAGAYQEYKCSVGFMHAWNLFECVCLYFSDRFGFDFLKKEENKEYLIKLLSWSLLIRVHLQRLAFVSINKYVLCDNENCSSLNMFTLISQAKHPMEILNFELKFDTKNNSWDKLKLILMKRNGYACEGEQQ